MAIVLVNIEHIRPGAVIVDVVTLVSRQHRTLILFINSPVIKIYLS